MNSNTLNFVLKKANRNSWDALTQIKFLRMYEFQIKYFLLQLAKWKEKPVGNVKDPKAALPPVKSEARARLPDNWSPGYNFRERKDKGMNGSEQKFPTAPTLSCFSI